MIGLFYHFKNFLKQQNTIIMKKKTEQKLILGKIKIAGLSKDYQRALLGGMPPPVTRTRCNGTCPTPQSAHCTSRVVINCGY